jgi:predicted transport protein
MISRLVAITEHRALRNMKIEVHLCLKKGELNDPKSIASNIEKLHRHIPAQYSLMVDDKSDLGYVLTLIRQAYDKN